MKFIIDMIGYSGGIIAAICFMPQILKTIKTKSVHDISVPTFVLRMIGLGFWLVYGLATHAEPLIICNIIAIALLIWIIFLYYLYKKT